MGKALGDVVVASGSAILTLEILKKMEARVDGWEEWVGRSGR